MEPTGMMNIPRLIAISPLALLAACGGDSNSSANSPPVTVASPSSTTQTPPPNSTAPTPAATTTPAPAPTPAAISCADATRVFAGGVSGIDSLATDANSDSYRALCGGLYLHHSGWAPLPTATKDQIIKLFDGRPVMVEIGYNSANPNQWLTGFLRTYYDLGLRPEFVTANAFDKGKIPDPVAWKDWIESFRTAGVAAETKILPTFEYQNFRENIDTLPQNTVSLRTDFQDIITASGGITLDTPSGYVFGREENYRKWVIDAIKWTQSKGYKVVIIFSPHDTKTKYADETLRYLTYLKDNGALPDAYAVENYSTESPTTYVNIVGNEDTAYHQLGVAYQLIKTWLSQLR
jgi:hypothetical protein